MDTVCIQIEIRGIKWFIDKWAFFSPEERISHLDVNWYAPLNEVNQADISLVVLDNSNSVNPDKPSRKHVDGFTTTQFVS